MTLTQLEYFCAVCRYHSITRAAAALYVSQPAISMAIRELEAEFHLELFHHAKNRIHLTKEGERFYARAEKLIHESQSIYSDFACDEWGDRPLRIGIPPLIASVFFPALSELFMKETGIPVQLMEYASMRACRLVEARELDIALGNLDFHGIERFHKLVLMEDETVYCVAKTHPLASRTELRMEDLLDGWHVFYNRDSVHNQTLVSRFQRMDRSPRVLLYSSQLATTLDFVRMGGCGAFLYESIPVGDEFVEVPLVPKLTTKFGLVWKDEASERVKAFVDFAKRRSPEVVS